VAPLGNPQVPCFIEFISLLSFLAVSIVTCPWDSLWVERILTMRVNAGVVHDRMYFIMQYAKFPTELFTVYQAYLRPRYEIL
jgi:hypothetical protein